MALLLMAPVAGLEFDFRVASLGVVFLSLMGVLASGVLRFMANCLRGACFLALLVSYHKNEPTGHDVLHEEYHEDGQCKCCQQDSISADAVSPTTLHRNHHR